MSHYIHNVPGRLRVQSAQLRHKHCKAEQLCAALSELSGIQTHTFNHKAGSILVQYDHRQVSAEDILYQMHKSGCLEGKFSHALSAPHSGAAKLGNALGNVFFGTLVKKGLETSVASFAKALI